MTRIEELLWEQRADDAATNSNWETLLTPEQIQIRAEQTFEAALDALKTRIKSGEHPDDLRSEMARLHSEIVDHSVTFGMHSMSDTIANGFSWLENHLADKS